MRKILICFANLNIWVKIVLFFCLCGALANTIQVCRDINTDSILLKLHLGFLLLYVAQVVFIFWQERMVWVIAVLQGVLALMTNADFTFVPLARAIGGLYYSIFPGFTVEQVKVVKYIFISLCFTLQMLSGYILFSLIPKHPQPIKEEFAEQEEPAEYI